MSLIIKPISYNSRMDDASQDSIQIYSKIPTENEQKNVECRDAIPLIRLGDETYHRRDGAFFYSHECKPG
jgi:hypothetical protein